MAVAIVAASMGAAAALDTYNLDSLARLALLPVYPALLAVVALAGGFHSASGEVQWMSLTAVASVLVWWGVLEGWRAVRRR